MNDTDIASYTASYTGRASPIDTFDWSASPLGNRHMWPVVLSTLVDVMDATEQAMFIVWGETRTLIYNAGFAALPGSGHPAALGTSLPRHPGDIYAGANFTLTHLHNDEGTPCGVVGTLAADEATRLLQSFVAALPGVVYAKDREGRMLVANRGTAELIGKPPAAFLGKTDAENLDDPAEAAAIMATDSRVMQSGIAEQVEENVRLPDGTPAVWFSTKAPLFDEYGRVIGLIGTSIDITERHRVEARRRARVELTERFLDLDDPADLAYAGAEILGRTLEVSRAGYGTIDIVAETVTIERDWNMPGIKSLSGTLRFRDYGSYIDNLKRGETVVFADAFEDPRTRDNAQKLVDISARAAINMPLTEQGRLVAILYLNHAKARAWPVADLAFIREVAMLTRTAIARRQAELDLQALADSLEQQVAARTAERDRMSKNSRDLLAVIDSNGILRQPNPAWKTILGYEPEDIIGRRYLDFVVEDDAAPTSLAVDHGFIGIDLTAFENRYRHKDGSLRWISWHTTLEGGLMYVYGRDVTEEKSQAAALSQAEAALRQSQKMEAVGQLTGGIAHDFNNMLSVVIGSLEMLGRRIDTDDTRSRRYVQSATEGAKRAALLTQRLLAFSRQQSLRPETIDANKLVGGMLDLLRHSLGAAVHVETVLAGGLWRIDADPNQLENVILNLAVNARDAMPEGGRLTIETRNAHLDERDVSSHPGITSGQYVVVAVTDTGVGMPEEVIGKAFDPFFTTKEVGKGTGLGLSQVYGFVKQSGGHVKIFSQLGQGTMVKIYLPRQTACQQERGGEGRMSVLPRGKQQELVLVVEDEPAVRELSAEVLGELGYRVLEADGAAAALRLIDAHDDIALLFTDVVMPEVNGRKLADAATRRRPNLKVLFTTGYTRDAVVHNGVLDAGVELIAKPFTIEDLATKVRAVLDG